MAVRLGGFSTANCHVSSGRPRGTRACGAFEMTVFGLSLDPPVVGGMELPGRGAEDGPKRKRPARDAYRGGSKHC